ncbi:transcriptional regulator [Silicimonas algicola]|uniref:Helix-turn-helix protein n=1 Tax=Silicimonas algicola TaxID=1826607 RepID=A0A316G022_9RHOB|nr:transcriptional regulator [Silicimonas algicola]PWK53150.1 hypothetical protein C8D95_11452 [Silicimonas algicola]
MTGLQFRVARLALRLSVVELAKASSLGTSTIKRIEMTDGKPSATAANVIRLRETLEGFGIEFIEAADGAPGIVVRLESSGIAKAGRTVGDD